ncbi:MAG: DNA repair protein RecN [Lachnospiraceae bacterium]|nr:DNA repair protein RecN [Lachnospiraceae bacterium]
MLSELHVKNFAILDEVSVEFGKGLNVLTGETGAGKSLLLGSVNAALGGKVSKDFLGSNGDYALAELLFDNDECVRDLLERYELPESDMLVISRRITDTGRSVSRINGETVNAAIVKEIASRLFDVHGQHDHQTLLYPAKQLALLDRYAGSEALAVAATVRTLARDYRAAKKELAEAAEHGAARARELSMAQYEYDEIIAARLVAGEDDLLEERFRVLSNREKLTEACAEADSVLSTDGASVTTGIGRALRKLSKASSLDPKLEAIYEDLRLAEEQVGDIAARLSDYLSEITGTEAELAEVGERLDVINRLKSKYGRTIEAILAYAEEAERTIAKLSDFDGYVASLTKKVEESERALRTEAAKLTKLRRKAADELSAKVRDSLSELNFLSSEFTVEFRELEEPGETGAEEAEFMISANPGEPLRPLAKIASGGELSRVMLALKTASAGKDEIETLFFDEIDAGISGRTAQKVAEKLADVAQTKQVICITHLPQIAAMADCHFEISKSAEGGKTRTTLRKLAEDEVPRELARMLGGAEITDSVMANAREMRELAIQKKSSGGEA